MVSSVVCLFLFVVWFWTGSPEPSLHNVPLSGAHITRTRSLDTMPFSKSLQLDMEVWSWTKCDMVYAVATYWYGFGDTTANHPPVPDQARAKPTWPPTSSSDSPSSRHHQP